MGGGVFRIGSWRAWVHGVEGQWPPSSIEKEIAYHPMPCQCHGLLSIVSHIASVTASSIVYDEHDRAEPIDQ
jgi:hypothetical protein